jgi:hypothetical protein
MTAITVEEPAAIQSVQARMAPPSRLGDRAFEWLTLAMALSVVVLIILTGWQLCQGSMLAIKKFGFHFVTNSTWDPVGEEFGALPLEKSSVRFRSFTERWFLLCLACSSPCLWASQQRLI